MTYVFSWIFPNSVTIFHDIMLFVTKFNLVNTQSKHFKIMQNLYWIQIICTLLFTYRHLLIYSAVSINHFVSPFLRLQSSADLRAHAHWCECDQRPLSVSPPFGHPITLLTIPTTFLYSPDSAVGRLVWMGAINTSLGWSGATAALFRIKLLTVPPILIYERIYNFKCALHKVAQVFCARRLIMHN